MVHEHPLRSVIKGISWQTLGLFSTMLISYWFTGALISVDWHGPDHEQPVADRLCRA